MSPKAGEILSHINTPEDLRKLKEEELPLLCDEIREFILELLSANPGHLGASLGTVEMTVALHYAFNTPYDKLIWDVGHQAYSHKIITGRKERFHTNRMYKGISGFPKMSESEYDAFGVGHSSTSLSAALGMAEAARLLGIKNRHHIAVIGDGSMTGGMAMEAINNAGVSKADLLVVLNDNGIAIDKNVGAIKEYLTNITTSKTYNKIRDKIWLMMGGNTRYGANSREIVKQIGNALKSTITRRSNLFEAYGFRYFGPVDGHDVIKLIKILNDMKNIPGPKILHCITTKGKGFAKAEKDQVKYHAPGLFDKKTGEIIEDSCKNQSPKYQTVFGKTIIELAEMNDKIVGITPAMPSGSSLNLMMARMPERAFDVGIAEQHAVTFSAGLAASGMIPFCNIYSSFMQRAYDQIIHDVALQNLQVVMCLDRGGLVGEDGATHHGAFDLAYLRSIPNMTVASPLNEEELRNLMFTAQLPGKGPFAIRYPRGRGVMTNWKTPLQEIIPGTGQTLRTGKDIALITIGPAGNDALHAAVQAESEGIDAGVFNMRYVKPIDQSLLTQIFHQYNKIITIEDGTIIGGLGSAVIEYATDTGYEGTILRLGIPDKFIEQGTTEELKAECGFDTQGILKAIRQLNQR